MGIKPVLLLLKYVKVIILLLLLDIYSVNI